MESALSDAITLEPFIHQVGGRSSILLVDEDTVCKPLIPRELAFYQTLPEALEEFTPHFKGIINVRVEETKDGFVYYKASVAGEPEVVNNGNSPTVKTGSQKPIKRLMKLKDSSIEIVSLTEDLLEPLVKQPEFEVEDGQCSELSTALHNPWSLKCLQNKYIKDRGSTLIIQKFILLENLTNGYCLPCILDLKMGTRQYDDNANESKKKSQDAKVARTTSATLGVRLTGMQVYNKPLDRFKCLNKYDGRNLTDEGFKEALKKYFNNSGEPRYEVIGPMLNRLTKLRSVIQQLDTFRYFTSSLLLIYEGKTDDDLNSSQTHAVKSDIRMIDFQHSSHKGLVFENSPMVNEGPDEGYLFGLNSLIAMLTAILEKNE